MQIVKTNNTLIIVVKEIIDLAPNKLKAAILADIKIVLMNAIAEELDPLILECRDIAFVTNIGIINAAPILNNTMPPVIKIGCVNKWEAIFMVTIPRVIITNPHILTFIKPKCITIK